MPLLGRDDLIRAMGNLEVTMNNQLVAIYSQGLGNMITASPVHFKDGGSFKNGWFLKVGSPSSNTRGASSSGAGSYSQVAMMPSDILNKVVYFSNSTPQAMVIEYGGYPNPPELGTNTGAGFQKLSSGGYSKQAPSGVVRVELVRMKNKIRRL